MKYDPLTTPNEMSFIHDANSLTCSSEAQTAVLILNENGFICGCNNAAAELLEGSCHKIAGQHISTIVPQFLQAELLQEGKINPNMRYLSHIGYPFSLRSSNENTIDCNLFFNEINANGKLSFRLILRPIRLENTLN